MTGLIDKLTVVEDFLRTQIWFLDWGSNIKFVGMTVKIEPSGLFVIVRALSPEGPIVAFTGASCLESLMRKLKSGEERSKLRWRPDQFALDKK